MQNDWKTTDLGRPPCRSDGREKLATWPASQALELAANRRVRCEVWLKFITNSGILHTAWRIINTMHRLSELVTKSVASDSIRRPPIVNLPETSRYHRTLPLLRWKCS